MKLPDLVGEVEELEVSVKVRFVNVGVVFGGAGKRGTIAKT